MTGSDGSAAVELLVDDDRVFPGRPIERCLQLTYSGTLDDARIRLHGHRGADTGLGDLVTVTFELGTGEATDCADFRTSERLYQGRSTDLTIDHGSFADGIDLSSHIGSGLTTTFRTIVEVDDDNAAQGLGTEFWIVIEARP